MAGISVHRAILGFVLFITVVLIGAAFALRSFSSGLNAWVVNGIPDIGSETMMIRHSLLENESRSWGAATVLRKVKNPALSDERILKFVNRIVDPEKSFRSAQQGFLSNLQMHQLKQMTAQLKVMKTDVDMADVDSPRCAR
ncbi:hypothetical protein R1flu_025136 [Riccia fluitans]|uniref:Uncharacterized protein n=1 Tax=Riccia fluitans TaxID=41844 RepID=A0ABD1XWW6_9MARC